MANATKELNILRAKIKKLAKTRWFLTSLADSTGISFTLLSLFKDWKKSLSVENYFLLKKTLEDIETKENDEK